MHVSQIMTRDVEVVSPEDTIQQAAKKMDDLNVGVLPVCDGQRLVGMLTDRDITVRATSAGQGPETRIGDIMTAEVHYAFEDEEVEEVSRKMSQGQIRRLPVISRGEKKLVGIVSLGDLATDVDRADVAAEALERISEPSEPDR